MTTLSTLHASLMTWIAGLSQALSRSPRCHRQTWMRLSTLSSQGRRVALMDSLLRLSRHCRLPCADAPSFAHWETRGSMAPTPALLRNMWGGPPGRWHVLATHFFHPCGAKWPLRHYCSCVSVAGVCQAQRSLLNGIAPPGAFRELNDAREL